MYSEDLIYFIKRSGTDINPFVDITEDIIVDYGKAFLKEIPSESFSVSAKNGLTNMILVDSLDKVLLSKHFFVDFRQGIVYLHNSINGVKITFKYKGIGVLLYPSSRIYVDSNNGESVYTTLKEFIDEGKKSLESISLFEDILLKSEQAVINIEEVINKTKIIYNELELKNIQFEDVIINANKKIESKVEEISSYGYIKMDSEIFKAIGDYNTIFNNVDKQEKVRVISENSRISNESLRVDSENTRKTNESNRITKETSRVNQEKSRTDNEKERKSNEDLRKSSESDRNTNETSRVSSEKTRVINEDLRKSSESDRNTNETSRVSSEKTRVINENDRNLKESERSKKELERLNSEKSRLEKEVLRDSNETKRKDSETVRASNEFVRVNNENDRRKNETSRIDEESNRVKDENIRLVNETTRIYNEDKRITSETTRSNSENTRTINENTRKSSEKERISSEAVRGSNENTRFSNEETRKLNESSRISNEEKRVKEVSDLIKNTNKVTTNANNAKDLLLNLIDFTKYISEFSLNVQYKPNNIVSYNGSSYIAKKENIGNIPIGDITDLYWGLLAKKGVDGKGSVVSVNGVSPNINGNVYLSYSDVDAIGMNKLGVPSGVAVLNQDGKVIDGDGNEVLGKVLSVNGKIGDVVLNLFSGSYEDLTNKPKTFTPSEHKHVISDVTELQTTLNSKTNVLDFNNHLNNKNNPHEITSQQVNHISQKLVTDTPDSYPIGISIFGLPQNETVAWRNVADSDLSTNTTFALVETNVGKTSSGANFRYVQRVTFVYNTESGNHGTYEREGYLKKWQPFKKVLNSSDIVDDLITVKGNKPLSANQGKILNDKFNTHENKSDIHVSTTEKNTWNNKSNFSGSYKDLTNKPTIPDVSGKADKTELHNHSNKTVLDKLSETDGNILFDGREIISEIEGDLIIQQNTAPKGVEEGRLWLDTSDNTFQGTAFENLTKIKIGNFTIDYDVEKQSLNFLSNGISVLTINSNGIKVNGIIIEE